MRGFQPYTSLMQTLGIARLGRVALDLLYPPKCVLCATNGEFLCEPCTAVLPRAVAPRCDRCWLPLARDRCPSCEEHSSHLSRLRSVFRYEGDVRQLVHRFKFSGQSSLSPALGRLLASACEQHSLNPDILVPVPLTSARERMRGYNQATLMAKELTKLTGTPVAVAVKRAGRSGTQAASSSAEERRRNVEGVFSVSKGAQASVAGSHVLLIDDVATTGATLNACATLLLEAGAASVSALTLARED